MFAHGNDDSPVEDSSLGWGWEERKSLCREKTGKGPGKKKRDMEEEAKGYKKSDGKIGLAQELYAISLNFYNPKPGPPGSASSPRMGQRMGSGESVTCYSLCELIKGKPMGIPEEPLKSPRDRVHEEENSIGNSHLKNRKTRRQLATRKSCPLKPRRINKRGARS